MQLAFPHLSRNFPNSVLIWPLLFLCVIAGMERGEGYLLTAFGAPADATWGAKMFPIKRHDFGRVAIGGDAVFEFKFQNIYEQDIRVLSAQSSCSCTRIAVPNTMVSSGQVGTIVATLNTTGQHIRDKAATLTVLLETRANGQILRDTVQLFVSGYIRPDVVLTPGGAELGSVPQGETVVRRLLLEYVGRPDWTLTGIERSNPYIHGSAEQIKRAGGEVAYRITVTLKENAPVGYVKDSLRLTTNDTKPGKNEPVEIVVPIHGLVMAPLQVKPVPFVAGILTSGESTAKNIVVRSTRPFRIVSAQCQDERFKLHFSQQESAIQLVSVTFEAGESLRQQKSPQEKESVVTQITLHTNLKDQEVIQFEAHACLVSPDFLNAASATGEPDATEEAVTTGKNLGAARFVAP